MIARIAGQWTGRVVNELEDQWELARDGGGRNRRAFRRFAFSAIGWLPLLVCFWGVPSLWSSNSKLIWLAFAIASGFTFISFLRHFGGELGVLSGFWIWLCSAGLVCGIAAMAWGLLDTVLVLGGDGSTGWGETLAWWAGGGVIYGYGAKRIDDIELDTE